MDVGQTISHYLLKQKIGEGGFGDVFLVQDLCTNQELALKCSRPDADVLPDMHQRFLREVACALRLHHPNIVRTYEHGMLPNGVLFIVMEFIDGLELEDIMRKEAPLSFSRSSNIVIQILDALHVAHSQGIVHRDLKPANIMLSQIHGRPDFVKLLDFGIAKAFDGSQPDLTKQNLSKEVGFGTPQYMAKEQIFGGEIGPFTDIYAVGLLYYELLTGTQPMMGPTLSDIIYKQLKLVPSIPAPFDQGPLQDILLQAMAKDSSMRFASATEMKHSILRIFESYPQFVQQYDSAVPSTQPNAPSSLSDADTSLIDSSIYTVDNAPTVENKAIGIAPPQASAYTNSADITQNNYSNESTTTVEVAPLQIENQEVTQYIGQTNADTPVAPAAPASDLSSEMTNIFPKQSVPNISEVNTSIVIPDDNLRALYHEQQTLRPQSAEFHQKRTRVLVGKNLLHRPTGVQKTRLHNRIQMSIASSRIWRQFYASSFAQKIRSYRIGARFRHIVGEIYHCHFAALIAIICLLTLILVVSILIILT
ncbi:MAG: serine/threonine-protein kinase [Bradymonadales bacterium]